MGTRSASWPWDLLYFKGWRLAVGGGWRLAVGVPYGLSLRAVLNNKKTGFVRTALQEIWESIWHCFGVDKGPILSDLPLASSRSDVTRRVWLEPTESEMGCSWLQADAQCNSGRYYSVARDTGHGTEPYKNQFTRRKLAPCLPFGTTLALGVHCMHMW